MKLLLFSLISIFAWSSEFQFQDYKAASESKQYVKFESESTKLGFVTTSFDGYAKKFTLEYDKNGKKINNIKVVINANSIDTDNSSRDEKMFEQTLEVKKYPAIVFTSEQMVDISNSKQNIKGFLRVRNTEKVVTLSLEVIEEDGVRYLKGSTSIGLKEFKVPDPSIMIAKVRNKLDIKFKVKL